MLAGRTHAAAYARWRAEIRKDGRAAPPTAVMGGAEQASASRVAASERGSRGLGGPACSRSQAVSLRFPLCALPRRLRPTEGDPWVTRGANGIGPSKAAALEPQRPTSSLCGRVTLCACGLTGSHPGRGGPTPPTSRLGAPLSPARGVAAPSRVGPYRAVVAHRRRSPLPLKGAHSSRSEPVKPLPT